MLGTSVVLKNELDSVNWIKALGDSGIISIGKKYPDILLANGIG